MSVSNSLPEDQKVLWIGDMGAATLHRKSRINLLDFSQKRLKLDELIAPKDLYDDRLAHLHTV